MSILFFLSFIFSLFFDVSKSIAIKKVMFLLTTDFLQDVAVIPTSMLWRYMCIDLHRVQLHNLDGKENSIPMKLQHLSARHKEIW